MLLDVVFGGITGLVGTIWTGYNNRKVKELELKAIDAKHSYDIARIKAESDAMIVEARANIQITQSKANALIELEKMEAFKTSQEQGNQIALTTKLAEKLVGATGWVRYISIPLITIIAFFLGLADVFRSFARPLITMYLLFVSSWIAWKAWELMSYSKNIITSTQAVSILEQTISVLLYLSTTAVCWWFGDRMSEKGLSQFKVKK